MKKSLKRVWVRGNWTCDHGEGLVGEHHFSGDLIGDKRNPLNADCYWVRGWKHFSIVKPTSVTIIIPNEFT